MYGKITSGWLRHADFILLDIIVIQISYYFAYIIRNGNRNPYMDIMYKNSAFVVTLIVICVALFMEIHAGILSREINKEFKKDAAYIGTITGLESIYLFLAGYGSKFSRASYVFFAIISFTAVFFSHLIRKNYLLNRKGSKKRKILIVTSSADAENMIRVIKNKAGFSYSIEGIILTDSDTCMENEYCGIKSVCDIDSVGNYMQTRWIDEIFIDPASFNDSKLEKLYNICSDMGIVSHICLPQAGGNEQNLSLENVGGMSVITSSIRSVGVKELFVKRVIDIAGGIVGLIFTAIFTVIFGPLIMISSPGTIFFSQERIGKNGKHFKMYKFRSMYKDAEKRKAQLMSKNKMHGKMFKVDADPRIIGSGPDGTRHGIGWFIRKTSIDEFPQFLNVLKGDMSLVGTRPPTMDEWNSYTPCERARMSIKPGITGLWQVSGRSNVVDFGEVVGMDVKYIKDWSLYGDLKIMFRTVGAVIKGSGAE